jgi:hypothetical protein
VPERVSRSAGIEEKYSKHTAIFEIRVQCRFKSAIKAAQSLSGREEEERPDAHGMRRI